MTRSGAALAAEPTVGGMNGALDASTAVVATEADGAVVASICSSRFRPAASCFLAGSSFVTMWALLFSIAFVAVFLCFFFLGSSGPDTGSPSMVLLCLPRVPLTAAVLLTLLDAIDDSVEDSIMKRRRFEVIGEYGAQDGGGVVASVVVVESTALATAVVSEADLKSALSSISFFSIFTLE